MNNKPVRRNYMIDAIEIDRNGAIFEINYEILKDNFNRAGEASSGIKKKLKQLGIDSTVIRKVAIVTYEAEINVVIHSLGGHITALIKPDCIEIYIVDNGPGIECLNSAMTEGFSTATNEVRQLGFGAGMGLPNIKRTSDRFFIESEKGKSTKLKIVLNL
jgi:anti-sigma regulatory factor (Ser/Thr protein kinase)